MNKQLFNNLLTESQLKETNYLKKINFYVLIVSLIVTPLTNKYKHLLPKIMPIVIHLYNKKNKIKFWCSWIF